MALQEAEKAVALVPVSKDVLRGPGYLIVLAQVYARIGRAEAAIDQLEYLLSIPTKISAGLLQNDPWWDPLRSNPRFQRLLRKKQ